jgi:hypothetical protein
MFWEAISYLNPFLLENIKVILEKLINSLKDEIKFYYLDLMIYLNNLVMRKIKT